MGKINVRLPPKPKFLHGVPNNSIFVIALLILVNAVVWAACAVVLHFHPKLISPAALSYSLGLRHALDADHISAIDLMTRRLIASGQRPATVGTFFSLGHSTIVIITCVVVAATSGALRNRFDGFQRVGNIVGTSVSAAFLIILCVGNGWVLYKLVKRLREVLAARRRDEENGGDGTTPTEYDAEATSTGQFDLEGGGFMSKVLGFLFKAIDRPWKMYPLGIVFGLGFDTSSEIAILGIASIQAVQGTSIWLILIFPILFTCKLHRNPLFTTKLMCSCSWHVFARHYGWCTDDGSVHVQGILSRCRRHFVLLHCSYWNHCLCRSIHRHYPGFVSSTKCRRSAGELLGRRVRHWRSLRYCRR